MRGYSEDKSRHMLAKSFQMQLQHLRDHGVRVRVPKLCTIERWSINTTRVVRLWINDPTRHAQPRQVKMR